MFKKYLFPGNYKDLLNLAPNYLLVPGEWFSKPSCDPKSNGSESMGDQGPRVARVKNHSGLSTQFRMCPLPRRFHLHRT